MQIPNFLQSHYHLSPQTGSIHVPLMGGVTASINDLSNAPFMAGEDSAANMFFHLPVEKLSPVELVDYLTVYNQFVYDASQVSDLDVEADFRNASPVIEADTETVPGKAFDVGPAEVSSYVSETKLKLALQGNNPKYYEMLSLEAKVERLLAQAALSLRKNGLSTELQLKKGRVSTVKHVLHMSDRDLLELSGRLLASNLVSVFSKEQLVESLKRLCQQIYGDAVPEASIRVKVDERGEFTNFSKDYIGEYSLLQRYKNSYGERTSRTLLRLLVDREDNITSARLTLKPAARHQGLFPLRGEALRLGVLLMTEPLPIQPVGLLNRDLSEDEA